MARERSPNRDRAFEIWLDSGGNKKLKEIASELGVSDSQIRKWKNQDNWDEKSNGNVTKSKSNVTKKGAPFGNKNAAGHGAPLGNKNGLGNRGGRPAARNTNAVKTGEYQSLWMDALSDEEVSIFDRIDFDPVAQVDEEIMLFSWREREMMLKIRDLKSGLSESQRRVMRERRKTREPVQIRDSKGKITEVLVQKYQMVITEDEETFFRPIEDILRIEEALTRVQDKKLKAVELRYKIVGSGGGEDVKAWIESLREVAEKRRKKKGEG